MLIASSPPAVSADTHDHGGLGRSTNDATRVHTPIASSASTAADDCGTGSATTASNARAHRRN